MLKPNESSVVTEAHKIVCSVSEMVEEIRLSLLPAQVASDRCKKKLKEIMAEQIANRKVV